MEVTFPVLVLERDSGDVLRFDSIAEMQSYLERIDIENGEYAAWDANGHPTSLLVQDPIWLKLVLAPESAMPDLRDALKRFAHARHVILTESEQRLGPVALYEAITAKGGSGRKVPDNRPRR